jgi:5'-3' exonuclease
LILLDYNQIIIASLFANIGNHHNIDIDENLVRHMFLNVLKSYKKKFTQEFGELVICADGKNSWRKSVFPYYKAARKTSREDSDINWTELFRIISLIREELQEYFPYKFIHLEHCEADDVIGAICHEYGSEGMCIGEKILILSGDKDFIQLQKYENVSQYDPVFTKKWIKNSNPIEYLKEHIIRGDRGDGIPNVLSEDGCLALGKRQGTMTAKRFEALSNTESHDDLTKSRYLRNKTLIDLSEIPEIYREKILEEFNKPVVKDKNKLFNFFMEKKLKHLMTDLQDY